MEGISYLCELLEPHIRNVTRRSHALTVPLMMCIALRFFMTCDHECMITSLDAKWPGSVHDSRIFRESVLCQRFEEGLFDGLLVGDGLGMPEVFANPILTLSQGHKTASMWPTVKPGNKLLLNLTTNQNGLVTFSVNTANLPKADLNLVASVTPEVVYSYKSPYFTTDTRVVQLLQPASPDNPSFSELTIVKLEQPLKCGATFPVTVKYSFVGESGGYSADIVYMVLSRGVIVLHAFQTVTARASNKVTSGSVSFQLPVSVDMAPAVQILVYCVLPSENVAVGSASFDTEACFQNKVSLQFSPATAVPAEGNVLTVSAQAGSLCGLSAVDQSVRILEPGRRLSAEVVFNLLPVRSLSNYPYEVDDEQECLNVRPRRAVPADHAYDTFKSMGLKVSTNLPIQVPQCLMYRGLNYYRNFRDVMYFRHPGAMAMAAGPVEISEGDSSSVEVTVRTYFPETWIWQLSEVGATGSTQVPLTVPDTITTWETEAFCLSSKGLGLAPAALLTVFQPFFLELSLPYSIVRGESFELKATVFNYLSKCIMVKVTPASSTAFTLGASNEPYSSCLCANGRKTFKWVLTASVLGAVNVTVNASAEPSQTRCGTEAVTVPTRGRVDVVTRSLLVLMPSGCGEQNMIILAPNIYILLYLEVTGQLSAAIRETAIGYLQSVVCNFSLTTSMTRLTAFVLRSFGLAKRFVFIDPNVLQSAKDWIISQQGSNGCFIQQGTLYHNEMKSPSPQSLRSTISRRYSSRSRPSHSPSKVSHGLPNQTPTKEKRDKAEVKVRWMPCSQCGKAWEDTWEPASQFPY
ncbi:Alpha-2-macroglobulin [Anabarilius grahami]|uniref:Alpha-2-macroglobulin n=1 Tax=Anabarilius grahami TaxID=495550 RepID=A0A3N0XGN7_ANAGA|nr:Alpha-2-macroglobulin [Anabarilius grahami]